ncbi:MAG: SurA N-terminal domain-containing protein [Desulfobacterales bacterium]|nr:MAG: SurA N-terminal domain-containing protein [Desulfobacterales bacterium]
MKIGKSSGNVKIIILAAVALIAVAGVISYANLSAASKKAASADLEANIKTSFNRQEDSQGNNRDAITSGNLEITDNISKAVLRVDGMSCSGCIYTIKSSLSGIDGVQDVLVNIASGLTEVYYDNRKLVNVDRVADAISSSGYPSKVTEILSPDRIRKERSVAAARALTTIASVGGWDILRNDFNIELAHAKKRYAQVYGASIFNSDRGKVLIDNIKVQIVSRLIDEGIKMQEVRKSGFVVEDGTVDVEFNKFLNGKGIHLEKFRAALEENGYTFDYFMKKFERRVLINQYLNDNVLNGIIDKFEKQRRYTSWFNNAGLLATVVYYDRDLERLIQSTGTDSGCSGGSSCRAKK